MGAPRPWLSPPGKETLVSGRIDSLSSPRRAGGAGARQQVPWGLLATAVVALALTAALALVLPARQIALVERALAPDPVSESAEP